MDDELICLMMTLPKDLQNIILKYYRSIYSNIFWIQDVHFFQSYYFNNNKPKIKRYKINCYVKYNEQTI